jgi:hypothetical protein
VFIKLRRILELPSSAMSRLKIFKFQKAKPRVKSQCLLTQRNQNSGLVWIVLNLAFQKLFVKVGPFASVVTRRAMWPDISWPSGEYRRRKY